MTHWHLLIPAKGTRWAKSRTELPDLDRIALAAAMLADVVDAAQTCRTVASVHVVTRDDHVARWAASHGVKVHRPRRARGLNAELIEARDVALDRPDDGHVVVLGDMPCITSSVLSLLLDARSAGCGRYRVGPAHSALGRRAHVRTKSAAPCV